MQKPQSVEKSDVWSPPPSKKPCPSDVITVDSSSETETDEDGPCAASTCRLPDGDQVEWVQCDQCKRWFHLVCLDLESSYVKRLESYCCDGCVTEKTNKHMIVATPVIVDHTTNNTGTNGFAMNGDGKQGMPGLIPIELSGRVRVSSMLPSPLSAQQSLPHKRPLPNPDLLRNEFRPL